MTKSAPKKIYHRFVTPSRLACEVCDATARVASRLVYKVAYALTVAFGSVSPRRKKALASRFAAKALENVQKSFPTVISLLMNAVALWFLSTVAVRPRLEKEAADVTVVFDDNKEFLSEDDDQSAPPNAGEDALLDQTLAEAAKVITNPASNPPSANSANVMAALIKTMATATSFQAPTPSLHQVHRWALSQELLTQPGHSTQGGEEAVSGSSSGSLTGSGAGNGTGTGNGGGSGNGTGSGTYSAAGLNLPIGERTWIITDSSGSVDESGQKRMAREVRRYDGGGHTDTAFYSMLFDTEQSMVEAAKKGFTVIVWITDLNDCAQTDALLFDEEGQPKPKAKVRLAVEPGSPLRADRKLTAEEVQALYANTQTALLEPGVKLFIVSLRSKPSPQMMALVEATGGSVSIVSGESKKQ